MEHLVPNKRLGQNFLTSETIVAQMITAAGILPTDTVLEIGPGKGAITKGLLQAAARVIAIEKDQKLVTFLNEKFAADVNRGKLILISDDALEFEPLQHGLSAGNYKIVANIPYYITGRFLRNFLESDQYPSSITLVIQKEVGERITANDGKESILSQSVKAFGEPNYITTIPSHHFSPEPAVDSCIIHIREISKKNFKTMAKQKLFFSLLKAGFAHKRKVLAGNLKPLIGDTLQSHFTHCHIQENARAEDLTQQHWLCLTNKLDM